MKRGVPQRVGMGMTRHTISPLLLLTALTACGEDDPASSNGSDPSDDATTFTVRFENIGPALDLIGSGAFATPVGAQAPAPIGPGGAYEFEFLGAPGQRLSFATMFIPSNDLFFAPDGDGIPLFDEDGMPVTGDVTAQVDVWDAGTEVDQELGVGADQAMRQAGPDTGAPDPDDTVRLADGFPNLPSVDDVLQVTLSAVDEGGYYTFTARLENVSTPTTLETSDPGDLAMQAVPLSPGVYAVHRGSDPLFTVGQPDRGEGLEAIAEDGTPTTLAASLEPDTGITLLGSPGIYAVTDSGTDLFEFGQADRGQGLEAIAEDGMPGPLAESVGSSLPEAGVINTPVGSDAPGPIPPGAAYEFTVTASPGQRLHVVTMVVPSNDWLFTFPSEGVVLFDDDDQPISGDLSSDLVVVDLGTEVDMPIGFGLDQVQFQPEADTGAADADPTVRRVDDFADPRQLFLLEVTPQ